MMRARTGFFTSPKGRADLYTLGSQSKGCDNSASIADSSGGKHGDRNGVCDLGHERKRSGKRFLGGPQEGTAMTTCFKAGSDDNVDSSLLKNVGFVCCCRRSNRKNSPPTAFVENLLGRNSIDEAKGGTFRSSRTRTWSSNLVGGWSKKSSEVAMNTPSRTTRVTLSSEPNRSLAAARTFSAAV
jgi:hypothetical protein